MGRTSLLGCCKSLLRPSPTPKMRRYTANPWLPARKMVWLCSFMEGLGCILPSGQAVRGFQHDSVPHFSTELVHSVAQKPPSFQVLCPRLLQAVSQVFLVVLRAHGSNGSVSSLLQARCEGKQSLLPRRGANQSCSRTQLFFVEPLAHSGSHSAVSK